MTELVVLPGLDATATLHGEFVELLKARFDAVRVLAYPRERLLDYADLETWVRERLPAHAPFVLLGESFSGPLALAIAASAPAPLRGLVLSTTFARSPVPALSILAPLIETISFPVPPMRALAPLLLGRWTTPQLELQLHEALRSVPTEVLRFRAAAALRADASPHLSKISLPVLHLRATADRLLPRACARYIASSIPHSIVREVDGPHLLLQTAPHECAQAVAAFAHGL